MGFERVWLYRELELDVETTAIAVLHVITDLPARGLELKSSTVFTTQATTSGRRTWRIRFPGHMRGQLIQFKLASVGVVKLYGGRIYARPLNGGGWNWYALPITPTPEGLAVARLPILETPDGFAEAALPIVPTSEAFAEVVIPIAATPEGFAEVALPILGTPEGFVEAALPIQPTPEGFAEFSLPIDPTREQFHAVALPILPSAIEGSWQDLPVDGVR